MKQTKYYCDMCGKEIKGGAEPKYIPIRMNVGKHGEYYKTKIRILNEDYGGVYLDFCEDCKKFIASSFEFRKDVTKLKEELNKIMEEGKEE